ncbi:UNVERIFIED_CONTAM: hypothetical protein NCL1_44594 [Trichonephila clavipes]
MNEMKPIFRVLGNRVIRKMCMCNSQNMNQSSNESDNNTIWSMIQISTFVELKALKYIRACFLKM